MKPITRTFDYTRAEESRKPGYLKARFDRVRREQREQAEAQAAADAEQRTKVKQIKVKT